MQWFKSDRSKAVGLFVLWVIWDFPQWLGSIWPLLTDRTLPIWLSAKHWPGMSPTLFLLLSYAVNWLVIGLFGVIIGLHLKRQQPAKQGTVQAFVRTEIRLQFTVGNTLPLLIDQTNIWRWYSLHHVRVERREDGQVQTSQRVFSVLFLVFDVPVTTFRQCRVDMGGAMIPYEVKDSGPRHAIVVFDGDLGNCVVHFSLVGAT